MFVDELREGLNIALHPKTATKKTMTTKESISFYYRFSIIPTVIYVIVSAAFASSSSPAASIGSLAPLGPLGAVIFAVAIFWIGEPLGILIDSAIFHFFGKTLLKSFKNAYNATFTAMTYATLPILLLYWLTPTPVIGNAAFVAIAVWGFIVEILALSRQQQVSVLRAFGVILLSVLVIGAIVAIPVIALGLRTH